MSPLFTAFFLALYTKSLNYYFFQDDWFILDWVKESNILSLMSMRRDIIYWRPISMPLLYKANFELFGANPQLFHLATFAFFFLLLYFIYQLFLRVSNNHKTALFVTFIYVTSAAHFISVSWLSSTSYIMGALFSVSSLYFFLKKGFHNHALSVILFVFGLLSTELMLTYPAMLLMYKLTLNKKVGLMKLAPYLALVLIYMLLRFSLSTLPATGSYAIYLDKKTLSNIIWYKLWSLNVPESFKDLISPKFIIYSLHVMKQYWWIITACTLTGIIFVKWLFELSKNNKRLLFFSSSWFMLALIPVIIVPDHSYPNYLSIALIGMLFAISGRANKQSTGALCLISIVWFFSSCATITYTQQTHWIVNQQAASKAYTALIKTKYPNPEPETTFILELPGEDFARKNKFYLYNIETLSQSLNGQHALRVLYNDETISTQYRGLEPKTSGGDNNNSKYKINPI